MSEQQQRRGVYALVSAQFCSTLADNALLFVAIGLLIERNAAAWMVPALRLFFYVSCVLLAAFGGGVADALPKDRVLFATNLVRIGGCGLLLTHIHPLLAYAFVGVGAAAYSPAKYGILPEMLPPSKLVAANAWMEAVTVLAILLGFVLGSALIDPTGVLSRLSGSFAQPAIGVLGALYFVAALFTLLIPRSRASDPRPLQKTGALLSNFGAAFATLWRDPASQISLAVTTLFWAASAVLQFIVLRWAQDYLQLSLAQSALLQTAIALGMVGGAIGAARWVPLHQALRILPLGVAVGAAILGMLLVTQLWVAVLILIAVGAVSGLLLVPMNALLQNRGQLLMHPGQSIAVQSFTENLASLVLLAVYGGLIYAHVPLLQTILGFGGLLFAAILLVLVWHGLNQRRTRHRPEVCAAARPLSPTKA